MGPLPKSLWTGDLLARASSCPPGQNFSLQLVPLPTLLFLGREAATSLKAGSLAGSLPWHFITISFSRATKGTWTCQLREAFLALDASEGVLQGWTLHHTHLITLLSVCGSLPWHLPFRGKGVATRQLAFSVIAPGS